MIVSLACRLSGSPRAESGDGALPHGHAKRRKLKLYHILNFDNGRSSDYTEIVGFALLRVRSTCCICPLILWGYLS